MITLTPPLGFVEQRSQRHTWWIKVGWEEIVQAVLSNPRLGFSFPIGGGRGGVYGATLGKRGNGIIRHYRRGGLVRHFIHDLYWDRPPRPLAELHCTEVARQRGVPTGEALGAGVEWVTLGLYRGTFVTRAAEGFINLWEWLQTQPTGSQREAVVAAVARTIAQLHTAGIEHADLNLTNVLVRSVADTPLVLLIDFDRARVFTGSLTRRQCERNLHRLHRSLNKLDPERQFFSLQDLEIFCREYHQDRFSLS